jgi:hypothetical protein
MRALLGHAGALCPGSLHAKQTMGGRDRLFASKSIGAYEVLDVVVEGVCGLFALCVGGTREVF